VYCVRDFAGRVFSLFGGGDAAGGLAVGICLGMNLNVIVIGMLSGSTASDYFRYAPASRPPVA
jgi:hypothetical protein